jgi:hypothetical protein
VDESGPKGPPAAPVNEKSASGVLVKVKQPKRKTREEKRVATMQMIDWATSIDEKHPNLVHEFLTSKDDRVRYECWKTVTAYRFGIPTGRVEVDLNAASRILAASRGVSQQALLARAARIVDAVATADEPTKQDSDKKKSETDIVDAEPVE